MSDEIQQAQSDNNEEPGDRLCYAALRGDLAEVQQLLASGIDPNAYSSRFRATAILKADEAEIIEALLQAGADVRIEDEFGNDALSHGLELNQRALVEQVIQLGADINRRNKHGWTRLRLAAFRREPDAIALLLELGADPTLDQGKLLSAASWYGGVGENEAVERIIDLLVKAGEDVNATDHHGYSALHCAVLEYAHTPSDEEWWNASSDGPDISATRALLRHGANPNLAGKDGKTPLLLAAQAMDGALCVEALLAAGADPEKTGSGGITPLMVAALRHQPESMRLLLEHGVDAHRVDVHRHNALFYAQQGLAAIAEDEAQSDVEAELDQDTKEWYQEFTRQRKADVERCIALLEVALSK